MSGYSEFLKKKATVDTPTGLSHVQDLTPMLFDHQSEVWADIPGYEGLYQASNTGVIKSIDREIIQFGRKKNYTRKMIGCVVKSKLQNSGYPVVWLSKGGVVKAFTVHRLVLLSFSKQRIGTGLDVNHIDGDKQNNNLANLEWCTRSENSLHAHKIPGRKQKGCAIKCIETGISFNSIKNASVITGINSGSISHVLSGRSKTAGGLTWQRG